MTSQELVARLLKSSAKNNGCRGWNRWRQQEARSHSAHGLAPPQIDLSYATLTEISRDERAATDSMLDALSRADLRGADLSDIDLTGMPLGHTNLAGANLTHAILNHADLSHISLDGARLGGAKLTGARLNSALLWNADLSGADLSYADLTSAEIHCTILSGADLSHADLSNADLKLADLSGAKLCSARLNATDLATSDLSNADLSGADLTDSILCRTRLNGTDLRSADLRNVDFRGFHGRPRWPHVDEALLASLRQEAGDPTTAPHRLEELARQWPGCQYAEIVVGNPHAPQEVLNYFAWDYPAAFLTNPILPQLFQEDPRWLDPIVAQIFLYTFKHHPACADLMQQYATLLSLITARADEKE